MPSPSTVAAAVPARRRTLIERRIFSSFESQEDDSSLKVMNQFTMFDAGNENT
jgi:hypothetical protein